MTASDCSEIQLRLDRIEAKLDQLLNGPKPDILDVDAAKLLTGARSDAAFYRLLPQLGVKPYTKGRYRRSELENAIAKLALKRRLKLP